MVTQPAQVAQARLGARLNSGMGGAAVARWPSSGRCAPNRSAALQLADRPTHCSNGQQLPAHRPTGRPKAVSACKWEGGIVLHGAVARRPLMPPLWSEPGAPTSATACTLVAAASRRCWYSTCAFLERTVTDRDAVGHADQFPVGKHGAGALVAVVQDHVHAGGQQLGVQRSAAALTSGLRSGLMGQITTVNGASASGQMMPFRRGSARWRQPAGG
jgi:hypothetical protein